MPTALVAWSVTATLAFSPFSFGTRTPWAAPAKPGWDEVEKKDEGSKPADGGGGSWDNTAGDDAGADAQPTEDPVESEPVSAPAPNTTPPPNVDRPEARKGTGLLIAAGVTGGVAWILSFTRMALVKQCADAVQDAENADAGLSAASTCWKSAGVGNVVTLPFQYAFNLASWGLAAGGGAVRGKHDGIASAWDGKPSRTGGAFIGAGAALLSLGIIGRITAAALVLRPFRALASTEPDVDKFARNYRLRLFGVQISSASIAAGLGMMVYGIVYNSNLRTQSRRLGKPTAQVHVAPDFNFAPGTGMSYTGVALNGRF